jgi:hypothetical protein
MDTTCAEYVVRRLRACDAQGVADCVRRVYGDSYIIHTELYHPEEIVALNESGRLVSVVALSEADEIVGHYALERPDPHSRVVESGEAMVVREHQHHHLLEKMRTALEEEAARLGLVGIFGRTVTNHLFSQKMVERFGERPCGVSLGRTPRCFRNMQEALSQRMSIVFYFKYLRNVDAIRVHVPPHHHDICREIYAQFGVRFEAADSPNNADSPDVAETGELAVEQHTELQRAVIMVRRVGKDTIEEVRQSHRDLREARQAEVVYLELPLSQAGTPEVCRAAEADGFFFSGVAPLYFPEGDVLRLQYLNVTIDTAALQIESPFARTLLTYIEQERQRTGRASADDC